MLDEGLSENGIALNCSMLSTVIGICSTFLTLGAYNRLRVIFGKMTRQIHGVNNFHRLQSKEMLKRRTSMRENKAVEAFDIKEGNASRPDRLLYKLSKLSGHFSAQTDE